MDAIKKFTALRVPDFWLTARPCAEALVAVATVTLVVSYLADTAPFLSSVFARKVLATFGRTLLIPALAEELLWRVGAFYAVGCCCKEITLWSPQSIIINLCYSGYHHLLADWVAENFRISGAPIVFRAPAFLAITFFLGLGCTHAYMETGRNPCAPVIVHAAAVTFWLTCLGGEEALRP